MSDKEFRVRHGLVVSDSVLVANTVTGNVGIGISNPAYKIDVAGAANISNPTLIVAGQNVVSTLNAAFGVANNALANVSNVVFSGNLTITGALQVGTGTVRISSNSIDAQSITVAGSAIPSGAAANLAFDTANAAYGAANNVGPQIAPAFNTANAAFDKANTALQNTSGVSFNGNFYVPSGKFAVGTTSSGNQGLTVYNSSVGETGIGFTDGSSGGRTWEIITGGSAGGFSGGRFGIYDRTAAAVRFSVDTEGNITSPLGRYMIPDTGGSQQWVYFGRWSSTGQLGSVLSIESISHAGFNADFNQNQITKIYFKVSNGSSTQGGSSGVFYGDGFQMKSGPNTGVPSTVRVVQVNTSTYDIYGLYNNYTGPQTYYTVTAGSGVWTHSGTIASPSGNYIDLVDYTAKSQSASGYSRLPNGLIIQWGNFSIGDGGTQNVTFPIAFAVACYAVNVTQIYQNGADQYQNGVRLTGFPSTTGVSIRQNTNGTNSFFWVAIGF